MIFQFAIVAVVSGGLGFIIGHHYGELDGWRKASHKGLRVVRRVIERETRDAQ